MSHKKKPKQTKLNKVLAHLKGDQKTFKGEIVDDKKLIEQLGKAKK